MKWWFSFLGVIAGAEILFFLQPATPLTAKTTEANWMQEKEAVDLTYWFSRKQFRGHVQVIYPSSILVRNANLVQERVMHPHFILQDSPERTTLLDAEEGTFDWRTSTLTLHSVNLDRFCQEKKILTAQADQVELVLRTQNPETRAVGLIARGWP